MVATRVCGRNLYSPFLYTPLSGESVFNRCRLNILSETEVQPGEHPFLTHPAINTTEPIRRVSTTTSLKKHSATWRINARYFKFEVGF